MTVIDVHTHMCSHPYMDMLEKHGGPHYSVETVMGGQKGILLDGAPFMTLTDAMFDYDLRIRDMDDAKVDLAVVSLSACNVYWGGPEVSLEAAREMNDSMAAAQTAYPDRIRWFASLPWQYPELALEELQRSLKAGAVGVMVLANVAGTPLTDEKFAPVWQAIDDAALPVLVHPHLVPGHREMQLERFNLGAAVGFMFDTSLAVARMVFDDFFDRYPNCKIIAAHAGGTLPYIAGRLDMCWDNMAACREKLDEKPSEVLKRVYYDTVTFRPESLSTCLAVGGEDQVMYGSDYPHNIGDMKGCLARVDDLPGGPRDKVRNKNAERIFNL